MTVIKRESSLTKEQQSLIIKLTHNTSDKKGGSRCKTRLLRENNDCKNNDPYSHQTMNLHFVQKTYTVRVP